MTLNHAIPTKFQCVERGTDEGLTLLRRGLDALRLTGAELRLPFYFGLLAEVCALSGRMEEALANVASGFAFQTKNGERWSEPELHRIHGEVLLRTGNNSGARLSYGRAIEAARSLGARMLEIRAEASLRELPGADKTRRNAAEQ